MAAETCKQIGTAFDGREQSESIDGAAGAVGDFTVGTIFNADDDGRLGGALFLARGEDADDAAMPTIAVDEEEPVGAKFSIRFEALLDNGERSSLHIAALAIEAFELGSQ